MPARKKIQNANGRPVWADISLSALSHNLHAIRDFVNPKSEKRATPRKVLCIVKGNGYGHGGPQVAKALEEAGADWFGVTGATEGEQIRKAGVRKPILALTSFWRGEEAQLLANNISPAIIRCEQLAALDSAASTKNLRASNSKVSSPTLPPPKFSTALSPGKTAARKKVFTKPLNACALLVLIPASFT